MSMHDDIAWKALSMGKSPADFHRAAQLHANSTWFFLIVTVCVWYFADWKWSMIPAAFAAISAMKSISSTMIEVRLERIHAERNATLDRLKTKFELVPKDQY